MKAGCRFYPSCRNRSSSLGWGSSIRATEVLFGMTEFRLRQYSPIQSNPVAGNGITPFGRDRWFQHPDVAGIGIPASRFHLICRKWSSSLGWGSSIREAEVLFGMTEFRLRQYSPIQSISIARIGIILNCRNRNSGILKIAWIGITPFGRERWFRHPEDCRHPE